MDDEAPIRHGREAEPGDAARKRAVEQSPLQGRAAFIKNWDWELVASLNRGACERGKAQFGHNSETHGKIQQDWEARRPNELSLGKTLDFLKACHRSAPFLFFNGNTFGEIARRIVDAIFIEFPIGRRREASSLAAHYVAGVLDRKSMEQGLATLAELANFVPGQRVRTFKGSARGEVLRVLEDGRIVWRPDGSKSELLALPESLLRERRGSK
jgi:hypothetical protein